MLGLFLLTFVHRLRTIFGRGDRRLRAVALDPRLATERDIELLVRAHGAPEPLISAVVDRMAPGRLVPERVWRWTVEHDGIALAELFEECFDYEIVEMFGSSAGESESFRIAL